MGVAQSANEGLLVIQKHKPEIVFLDIEMQGSTGFDMLERIKEKTFETIFVTAYDQYAIKAFRYSAFDYLLKPITISALKESIKRFNLQKEKIVQEKYQILEQLLKDKAPKRIALTSSKGLQFVSTDQIFYLSSDRSYTTVHLQNGPNIVLSNRSLNEFEGILKTGFVRIHKSFLVNIHHVKEFSKEDGGIVIMSNGDELLLSRRKKENFLIAMNDNTR